MDKKDPPIVAQDFVGGVKIVDIGELRVARGLSRRPYTGCRHLNLIYDNHERRIWCEDCETNMEAFDAFEALIKNLAEANAKLADQRQRLKEATLENINLIAAKKMNEMWSSRKMVPCCPHCLKALLPEMFKNGATMMSKQLAIQIFEKDKKK